MPESLLLILEENMKRLQKLAVVGTGNKVYVSIAFNPLHLKRTPLAGYRQLPSVLIPIGI
jgi:hypothetical protein